MSVIGFDRRGMPRPALIVRPFKPNPQETPMMPAGARPTQVARCKPVVAVLGEMNDQPATLLSLMFVLDDGFLLEMPLTGDTLGQLRAVLGPPDLPDDDPELTRPSWA
ncbi:MAG: hypothetical protein O3C65_10565 [Proteobacteria bacterium]|nr:hypothetical protein [Pseudomonadota bacterium]MDA1059117.1 hypothetical protein [Pseudomonadota bacterium]